MTGLLRAVARRLWPELFAMHGLDFHWGWSDLVGILFGAPLAGLGLAWLLLRTDPDAPSPWGGVYLEVRRVLAYHDAAIGLTLLPAMQTLTAQLSSVLHGARVYAQTLAFQKTEQELALAGRIQAGFLPATLPAVAGWQLAARLEPARQTSGDFYDFMPLPDGCLAIVVADVADKGLGAALYMALSRTLLRTYAAAYPTAPAEACRATNQRILTDTHSDLFVTLVLAILDPAAASLTYCNAGHNPPLLLRRDALDVHRLERTGVPLGMFEDATWQQRSVRLEPGDVLLLYTDGITEAENGDAAFFGEARLLGVATAAREKSAAQIGVVVQTAVRAFMKDAQQADDITWVVIKRDGPEYGETRG